MLHQAAELTRRALIRNLAGTEKKTHEIRVLKKHALRIAPQLSPVFPEEQEADRQLLQLFDDAYLKSRYNSGFTINDNELHLIREKVMELMARAELVVAYHLAALPDRV